MIPTPARRRQLFEGRQVSDGDCDDDDENVNVDGRATKANAEEPTFCDHQTNQQQEDNHRLLHRQALQNEQQQQEPATRPLTLAQQRLLLCKEQQVTMQPHPQQHQQEDDEDDSIKRAYIHRNGPQHLISDNLQLYSNHHHHHLHLHVDEQPPEGKLFSEVGGGEEDNDDEDDEEEEEYLGLDTIEEEDELMIDPEEDEEDCDNKSALMTKLAAISRLPPAEPRLESPQPRTKPQQRPPLPPPPTSVSGAQSLDNNNSGTNFISECDHDEQQEDTMTTLSSLQPTSMAPSQEVEQQRTKCDTNEQADDEEHEDETTRKSINHHHHHHRQQPQTLLPSTNRLISEHQARQQQTALFRALAERQKLLDELAPSERQQVDLMSTTLPNRSRRAAAARSSSRHHNHHHHTIGRTNGLSRLRESTSETRLSTSRGKNTDHDDGHLHSTRGGSGGVPLSSVDLSSMSDRMLDELLGHIASASSSSLSSNGESLDSSDFSRTSSSDDDDLDGNEQRYNHNNHHQHNNHRSMHSHTGRLGGALARTGDSGGASHAPSVIGVHEDLDMMLAGSARSEAATGGRLQPAGKCREAHRKSKRRNSHERDDDDDDDVQDELRVCVNQTAGAGGSGAHSAGNSLSPIAHNANHLHDHQRQHHIRQQQATKQLASNYTNAPSPIESSSSSGEPSSSSTINSSFSLGNSSYYSSNSNHLMRQQHQQQQLQVNQRADQSVEAILGRMLEALNEVAAGRGGAGELGSQPSSSPASPSGEPQEQLNDLLERGFLHLEQLLNCSLAPSTTTTANNSLPIGQQQQQQVYNAATTTMNRSHLQQQQQPLKLISTSTTLMSKDSDYGSDTQSADCYASSQLLSGSTTNLGQMEASESPSSSSSMMGADKQRLQALQQTQAKVASPGGALSPLAIDLSFKLAESLRRLAQQQQQAARGGGLSLSTSSSPSEQAQAENGCHSMAGAAADEQLDSVVVMAPADESSTAVAAMAASEATTDALIRPAKARKAPMKSIVMINSNPAASKATAANVGGVKDGEVERNLTPNDRIAANQEVEPRPPSPSTTTTTASPNGSHRSESRQSRQQHKTCVNLNSTPTSPPPPSTTTTNIIHPNSVSDNCVVLKRAEAEAPNEVTIQQVNFERRRQSARSSLRRRPSFTGSVGSVREARPGSPVPRPVLEIPASGRPPAATTTTTIQQVAARQQQQQQQQTSGGDQKMDAREQKQLQRVLVLGQKYNYSPAKLAASKLSSKLQLKQYQQQQTAVESSSGLATAAATNTEHQQTNGYTSKTKVSGRVLLDVGYFAKSASLTVHLMECQQLAGVSKRRTTSNPYVKLYLLPDRSKAGKRKSSLKRNELSPKFDQRFTFGPVQLHEFERRCLWLSVWHKDRLGRNDFLGELLLPLAQVRQHLFTSDLCQSTSPKWYQLSDRLQIAPTTNTSHHHQTGGEMAPRAQQRPAAAAATGEQVASKLSEFERRAARLAQAASVAPSIGHQTNQMQTDFSGRVQQQQSTTTDRMNVTLAPPAGAAATDPNATGQLFVALKFVPESGDLEMARRTAQMGGELRVLIKEARNLAPGSTGGGGSQLVVDNDRLPSPLAKCYLLDSNGQRLAKQKTSALKRTANPRWDHECSFAALRLANLQAQAIEIHLFNRDSLLSGRLAAGDASNSLGAIRLCKSASASNDKSDIKPTDSGNGMDSPMADDDSAKSPLPELCSEREARLWTQMLARPNIWVYGELPLRHLRPLIPIPQQAAAADGAQPTN